MREAIRKRAFELGFDDCCFTTAQAPDSASRFKSWLADNHHGEMSYLKRNAHKRVDPQQVLPEAKSIITLAVGYAGSNSLRSNGLRSKEHNESATESESAAESNAQTQGVIACYARYRDYHSVLAERLRVLAQFVDKLGGSNTRSLWYVDSGPLLERDLAQRAGLGFIGKHTNLISRRFGNWVLLAEIITTLELEADKPEVNRCGSCTRCLTACPTAAIRAPFQLDARRCISYLTIELKGAIPVEVRPAIGNRIFGCDDCLAVCPWNRFAREGNMMKAQARRELAQPNLIELLSLDEPEFKRRFNGSAILRTKRRGLLRNVCVALGNTGDETALPALQQAIRDPEPLIAEHAQWAIEQIVGRRQKKQEPRGS